MWSIVLFVLSVGAAAEDFEEGFSLRAVTKTYTWRMRVAKDRKVSGFLTLDSPAISMLHVDLENKKGEADLFVSVLIAEQKYTWNSTRKGADSISLSRSDSLFAKDELGLQRRFEIGAYGVADGNSSVCLIISLTADYDLGEAGWMLDGGSLNGGQAGDGGCGTAWGVGVEEQRN